MATVNVNPGVCGFSTIIKVTSDDMQHATVIMETECPNLKPMAGELKEVDGFKECFAKFGESGVFQMAKKYCKHQACPVPTAIIKGIEAACGFALPRDVEIKIKKD